MNFATHSLWHELQICWGDWSFREEHSRHKQQESKANFNQKDLMRKLALLGTAAT